MYLEGKVQTAKISNFFDGLEVTVVDRQVTKPSGGRPQYNTKIVRGLPGLDELRTMRKDFKDKKISEQDLITYAQSIPLPVEDQVLGLVVVDIAGKGNFRTLVCEVLQQTA